MKLVFFFAILRPELAEGESSVGGIIFAFFACSNPPVLLWA